MSEAVSDKRIQTENLPNAWSGNTSWYKKYREKHKIEESVKVTEADNGERQKRERKRGEADVDGRS